MLFPILTLCLPISFILFYVLLVLIKPIYQPFHSFESVKEIAIERSLIATDFFNINNQKDIIQKLQVLIDKRFSRYEKEAPKSLSENINDLPAIFYMWLFIYIIFLYFALKIIITFYNVAIANEIIHALNDQPSSLINGLKFASKKWQAIIKWAIYSAWGVEKKSRDKSIHYSWMHSSISWKILAAFVIPVIVRDDKSSKPTEVLKTSTLLIKQKWVESLIGFIISGIIGMVLLLTMAVSFLFIVRWLFLNLEAPGVLIYCCLAIFVISLVLFSHIQTTLDKIFKCALYLYATEGVLPLGFDEDKVEVEWKVKEIRAN
jgi:hypothetical protein